MRSRGEGPPTIALGVRGIGFLEEDFDRWLESRRKPAPQQTLRAPRVEGALAPEPGAAKPADGVAPPRRGPGRPRKTPVEARTAL